MLRTWTYRAVCGGSRGAQRKKDMGKLAFEIQMPTDDQSDKSLHVTKGEGPLQTVRAGGKSWQSDCEEELVGVDCRGSVGLLTECRGQFGRTHNFLGGILQPAF